MLGFVAFFAFSFVPGVLGCFPLALGAVAANSSFRGTLRARRRVRKLQVTPEGVVADGVLVVPRSRIVRGHYQPRATRAIDDGILDRAYGSSVRLIGRAGRILAEVECDPVDGEELLGALGLGAARERN